MSAAMEYEVKSWTAKRKSALVIEILLGKTMMAEPICLYDLLPSEIETWMDEAKQGMENALDTREQYEKQIKQLQEEGVVVSISQLCRLFKVPRRTFCYQLVGAPSKVKPVLLRFKNEAR